MKGIDLKKKLGPLPVWGWALLGAGGLGVVYYMRSKSSSSTTASTVDPNTIDPATGIPYSQELQAAQANAGYGAGAGGVASTPSSPTFDTSGLATGTTSTDQLDAELQAIQAEISTQSTNALTNTSPATTITGEATDLLNAQAALASLGLGGSPTPTTGGTAAAKGKSAAGLTILAQLKDLQAGLIAKTQLGPNAKAQLTAVGGNVAKAITARATPLAVAAAKPTTHTTVAAAPPKATVKSNNAEAARRGS